MRIDLETVRIVLRQTLGHDSFVASFLRGVAEDPACPSASINAEGVLRYGTGFAEKFISTPEDLFCLVMHEIMHPMFGHFIYQAGRLENLGADLVINASLSLLFPKASGDGCLFMKTYEAQGLEGLLRPGSLMDESRYSRLYYAFYGYGRMKQKLSTGEVIQSLKVLTPDNESLELPLLGSHGASESSSTLNQETLCRIAEELKRAAQAPKHRGSGYGGKPV